MVHNDCDGGACYECALDEGEATPMTDIDKLIEELRNLGALAPAAKYRESFAKAADTIAAQSKRIEELENEREWVCETLVEINPSNYDHADVCEMNSKSVEVILALSSNGGSDNG